MFYHDTAAVIVPDTVRAGESFEVGVTTFGGGCTQQVARTDVRLRGAVVEVRPYDRRRVAAGCTLDLRYLEHRAALRLPTAGVAVVRFIGAARGPVGRAPARTVATRATRLERRVVVIPPGR